MNPLRIALIGDRDPAVIAHQAIPPALRLAGEAMGTAVDGCWVATTRLDRTTLDSLDGFDGIWCVPATPYANPTGAFEAMRRAREQRIPFLGTCGGFQHALIEFARNVAGIAEAEHEESEPDASVRLISRLSCSLVEVSGEILLEEGSRALALCGQDRIEEGYHCNFGLNPVYEPALEAAGLRFTGRDAAGEVRVLELPDHPFFLGTLFQPERASLRGELHPLVRGFVRAALAAGA